MRSRTPKSHRLLQGLSLSIGLSLSGLIQAGALHDLYLRALDDDPQLKQAEATYLADREALPQARAGLLPQAQFNANTGYVESLEGNLQGYSLSLSQPVFDASRWFNFRRGELLSEQAKLGFELNQQNLIRRTVDSYLGVLRAQSALELAQARERALQRRLDQVNAQFEVGLIAITDVLDAQASYDDAAVQLIDAEGALRNSYEALERLGGRAVAQLPALKADYPISSVSPATPDAWLERALNDNLSLQISQHDLDAARQSARGARSEHWPTLGLELTGGETIRRGDTTNDNSIALTFAVPLYTGGGLDSDVRAADQRQRAALFSREDLRREVIEQTRTLLRDLNTSVQSVKARAQSIKSRETALEATEEGFQVGTRNVVDVLDAENALYQARLDYANARYGHVSTLFQFKQVVGSLSPDDLLALDGWLEPGDNPEAQ